MNLDILKKKIDKHQGIIAEYRANSTKAATDPALIREIIICEYLFQALEKISTPPIEEAINEEIKKQKARVIQLLNPLCMIKFRHNYEGHEGECREHVKKTAAQEFLIGAQKGYDDIIELGIFVDKINIAPSLTQALLQVLNRKNNKFIKDLIEAGADASVANNTMGARVVAAVRTSDLEALQGLLLLQEHGRNDITGLDNALLKASVSLNIKLNALAELLKFKPQPLVNDVVISNALNVFSRNPIIDNAEKIKLLIEKISDEKYKRELDFRFAMSLKSGAALIIETMLQNGYECTPEMFAEALAVSSLEVISKINKNKTIFTADAASKKLAQAFFDDALAAYKANGFSEEMFYLVLGKIVEFQNLINANTANQMKDGETLLMKAAKLKRTDFAICLLNAGANPNAGDVKLPTPLIYAMRTQNERLVNALLANKDTDVNRTLHENGEVVTALSIALGNEDYEMVNKLLLRNANVNLKSKDGKTLMQLGLESNSQTIKQAFEVKKAEPDMQAVEAKVQQEIDRLKVNAASCFGIGNMRKAIRIEEALKRAKNDKENLTDMNKFLNFKKDAKELSLNEALVSHRIGFFGKPNAFKNVMAEVSSRVSKRSIS